MEAPLFMPMNGIAVLRLKQYPCIGLGWGLHACWEVMHQLYAHPIQPFLPTSSAVFAICDLRLAAWYSVNALGVAQPPCSG